MQIQRDKTQLEFDKIPDSGIKSINLIRKKTELTS